MNEKVLAEKYLEVKQRFGSLWQPNSTSDVFAKVISGALWTHGLDIREKQKRAHPLFAKGIELEKWAQALIGSQRCQARKACLLADFKGEVSYKVGVGDRFV